METIAVSTVVRVPPEEAYAFVRDFEGYTKYSKYIKAVDSFGSGGEGTEYEIRFGWWKLSYGARTLVTDERPPESIEWRLLTEIDAHGRWEIEPIEENGDAAKVSLIVTYDPDSANPSVIDLPSIVSFAWVVDRVVGLIEEEGKRVVKRVVQDLEGESRPIKLVVKYG